MPRLLLTTVVPAFLLLVTPASADALDTSFSLAIYPYATLKRAAFACNKPISEHIDYKAQIMGILGKIPNINLMSAERHLEDNYEIEAQYGLVCTDALLELYESTKDGVIDMRLKSLDLAVTEKLRQQ